MTTWTFSKGLRNLGAMAVIVGFTGFAAAVNAATITNGSFENPVVSGSFNTYADGSGSLTGWAIANASLDHVSSSFWQASDGNHSLDLNGNGGAATISQTVSGLTIGQSYTIYFDMAGNPDGAPTIKTMDVTFGMAGLASYSFDTTGNSKAAMGWVTNSYSFVAGMTAGVLSFISTTDVGDYYGPALDNVRIEMSAVPLPAGLPLLFVALGGLGIVGRRRKAA